LGIGSQGRSFGNSSPKPGTSPAAPKQLHPNSSADRGRRNPAGQDFVRPALSDSINYARWDVWNS
jgi:hypothetical protein